MTPILLHSKERRCLSNIWNFKYSNYVPMISASKLERMQNQSVDLKYKEKIHLEWEMIRSTSWCWIDLHRSCLHSITDQYCFVYISRKDASLQWSNSLVSLNKKSACCNEKREKQMPRRTSDSDHCQTTKMGILRERQITAFFNLKVLGYCFAWLIMSITVARAWGRQGIIGNNG